MAKNANVRKIPICFCLFLIWCAHVCVLLCFKFNLVLCYWVAVVLVLTCWVGEMENFIEGRAGKGMGGASELGLRLYLEWPKVSITQLSREVGESRAGPLPVPLNFIFVPLLLSFHITDIYWLMSQREDCLLKNQVEVLTIIWATLNYTQPAVKIRSWQIV